MLIVRGTIKYRSRQMRDKKKNQRC